MKKEERRIVGAKGTSSAKPKLTQLIQRIAELEELAESIVSMAERMSKGESVQPALSVDGQRWYRGARELLVQQSFSGIKEFDSCYDSSRSSDPRHPQRFFTDIEQYITKGTNSYQSERIWSSESQGQEHFGLFGQLFQKARSLVLSVVEEVLSRELPIRTALSFEVAADEFETAEQLWTTANNDETLLRASGVVARVALERHLFTVVTSRPILIATNPPSKKKADISDVLNALTKSSVITAIQRSELDSLFRIGNNCGHPIEAVVKEDVKRLISRGREMAASVV